MKSPTKAPVLAVMVAVIAQASSIAYSATAEEFLGVANMSRANTQRIAVQQAVMMLASESSDLDGDGYIEPPVMLTQTGSPTGGGGIVLTSAAPKNDSYGKNLGYCAFDNGSTNASTGRINGITIGYTAPVLSVISAGLDNVFQTTCANIAAGQLAQGDDFAITYNSTQIQLGSSGTLYHGDPVADVAALNALAPASLKDGQIRVVSDSNRLYRWNTGTAAWVLVGSATDGTSQNLAPFGTLAAPGYAFLGATNTGMYMPAANKIGLSVNGASSLIIDRDRQNIGLGQPSMSNLASYRNVGIGYGDANGPLGALTSGDRNIAIGGSLLAVTTGGNNIALGTGLRTLTTGSSNVAIGQSAMGSGTGSFNVAVGLDSLTQSQGNGSVAIGTDALRYSNGSDNIGIGYRALANANTNYSIALGLQALNNVTFGNDNIGIGTYASDSVTTGSANTSMGNYAGGGIQTGSRNTSYGFAAGTATNKSATEQSTFIGANAKIEDTPTMAQSGFITLLGADTRARSLAAPNYFAFMSAIGAQANVTTINSLVLGRASTYDGAGLPSGDKTIIGSTGDSGAAAILQINGASQHRGLASAPAGSEGMLYYDTTIKQYRYHNGVTWTEFNPPEPPPALSSIANAIANNTLSNGDFAQTWGWQLSSNSNAFNITETAASTGGSGTQFLQTISTLPGSTASPLRVMTRGVEALRFDATNPQIVANVGTAAAPSYSFSGNQGTGFYMSNADLAASTGGTRSMILGLGATGLGRGALAVNTSTSVIGIGTNALGGNTTGLRNVAVGASALLANTTSNGNTAIGNQVLRFSTGAANTAVGDQALGFNTGGVGNVAMGVNALQSSGTGSNNVAIGSGAMTISASISGTNNTAIGNNASVDNTAFMASSSYITLLGSSSKASGLASSQPTAYMTAIGARATVTTINSVVLGRASTYVAGLPTGGDKVIIGATGDSGAAALLQINGASQHIGLATAPTGSEGMQYYDSTLKQYRYHNGTDWGSFSTPTSLSALTNATVANTLSNGAFGQTWGWQLNSNASAFTITESAASTGGSGTQFLQTISTLAGSTASPLRVMTGGVETFRVDATNPQIVANVGSVSAPAYSFSGSQGSGFYMAGTELSASVGGVRNLITGFGVTGFGRNTLVSNTNASATAFGGGAMFANTNGARNSAFGNSALSLNTTGSSNTAIGYFSQKNTSGVANTSIGESSLSASGTSSNNVAVGSYALAVNSSGNGNVGVGAEVLNLTRATTGSNNTLVGFNSSFGDTIPMAASGHITLLGANSKALSLASAQTNAYMTAIGAFANVTTINSVVLGRASTYVAGLPTGGDKVIVGSTGDSGAAALLQVNGASQHRGLATAPTGSEGMLYYDSTLKQYRYHNGTAWAGFSTPTALSGITNALANNTLSNGAFAQTWNWQLAGDTSAFTISESAASTGGSGSQFLQTISTLPGSTASPLRVVTRGVEAFRVDANNPQIVANVGTSAAPSYSFTGNQGSGFYMEAGMLSASVAGVRNLVTGGGVTGLGRNTLVSNTATNATAIGTGALFANTIGSHNVAVGTSALGANVDGGSNTAIGYFALKNANGNSNVGVGEFSLVSNTIGSSNIGIGVNALSSNTTGSGNVAIGANVLNLIRPTTGGSNTVIGNNATFADTDAMVGSGNITLLGANTKAIGLLSADANAYMTAVGAGANVSSIDTIVLGRATDNVVIGQTMNGPQQFYVNGTAGGTSGYAVSSDARFKMNVEPLSSAMAKIQKMQGVSYEFNHRAFPSRKFETGRQFGFIAQQIEPIAPEIVRTDNEGFKSVQYSQLVPLLVEGMKEQQSILKHLIKKDDVTLVLNIETLEGTQARFKRLEADSVKTKNLEAETARIGKLRAEEIESPKIESQLVRSDVFKTGEKEAFVGVGAFQPMFEVSNGMQFIVNATADDGSTALVSVSMTGGKVVIAPISGKGIEVIALGNQIGMSGANKKVKATWIRMG